MRTLSTILFTCLLILFFVSTTHAQWVQTSLDSVYVHCLAVSGKNLFAGTDSGVFRSGDNGGNYSKVLDCEFGRITALVENNTKIYVGKDLHGRGAVTYRSTDEGNNWAELSGGGCYLASSSEYILASGEWYDDGGSWGMNLSTNAGDTWNYIGGNQGGAPEALAINGTDLIVGLWGGITYSTDKGMTWTSKNSGLTDSSNVLSLYLEDGKIFAGTSTGIFLSTDNCASWTPVSNGLPDSCHVFCYISKYGNVFAGTAHGVFLTTNSGTNWTAVNSGLADSNVSVLTVDGATLFAGIAGTGVWKRPLSEMITDVKISPHELPAQYSLIQNYPNPFNPTTTIKYQLPTQSHVTLKIFDVLGREVVTLVNRVEEPGYKSVTFNASRLSTGVYYYRLLNGNYVDTKKLILLK